MSLLVDVVNAVTGIRQDIEDMRSTGIYQFFTKVFAEFIKWWVVGWYKAKLQALVFSWDIAQQILSSLNVSDQLNKAFGALDFRVIQIISFFRIPEAINIVLSAYTTRFVFNFLSF